jgi:hypothetical protein
MGSPLALSAREALVARRPDAVQARRTAATPAPRPAGTAPVDRFERAAPPASADESGIADDMRRVLNDAGEAARRAIEDNALVRGTGAALKRTLAPLFDKVAGFLETHVKNRVLRNTSFLVGTGLRLNIPGVNINGGAWGNVYVPSVELAKKSDTPSQALYLNYGADVDSPVGGFGWGRRGRAGVVVNLFFLTASFDEKQQTLFLGIPGLFGITVGKDVERGSYATFQNAVPLTPLLMFGPMWTQSFEVYSPLLDPINNHVVRPIAGAIVKGISAVTGFVDTAWKGLKTWLRGEEALEPAA